MSDYKIVTRSKNSLVFSTEIISFFYDEKINDIVEIRRLSVRKSRKRQHFIVNRYNDFKNAKRHDEVINIASIYPTISNENITLHNISFINIQAEALKIDEKILNNIVKKASSIILDYLFNYKEKTE